MPVAIVTETCVSYEEGTATTFSDQYADRLSSFADRYLCDQMIAGSVLAKFEELSKYEGVFQLQGQYSCLEMIGREQSEEIITP